MEALRHQLEIQEIIKARRRTLSLSQEDVSEMSGVAIRTVNALEAGRASVNLKKLNAIAEVLGLEIRLELKKLQEGNDDQPL